MPARINLQGQRFGKLLIVREVALGGATSRRVSRWFCQCDCGNTKEVNRDKLVSGSTRSCGCVRYDSVTSLIGKRFGNLEIKGVEYAEDGKARLRCACTCGRETLVRRSSLMNGDSQSCGCGKSESGPKTHGKTKTPEYESWRGMLKRCYDPNQEPHPRYGGRGIVVCDRWRRSFENFLKDMGERPSPSHTIDRKDNNGNYEPSNCRWATKSEQANNRATTKMFTWKGEQRTVSELAVLAGIPRTAMHNRLLRAFLPIDKAMSQPLQTKHRKS